MANVLPKLSPPLVHYFEDCVGCAACAPSCPYYYVDHKYAPVDKAEFLRQMLRSKYTLAGKLLGRVVGAKMPRSDVEWWKIMQYAYRCADCGHCYTTCPFGIDSGAMVRRLREVLYNAGYAPPVLNELNRLEKSGEYVTRSKGLWEDFVKSAGVPVGKKGARVLLMVTLMDLLLSRDVVLNAVKILRAAGEDFTLPERPLGVAPPLGAVVGDRESLRAVVSDIINYVEGLSPQYVVLISGCYQYPYFRFEATDILRRKFGFRVLHISELLYEYLKAGRLKLKKLGISATLHDSCQLARRGGVIKEPREVLKAVVNYVEPKHGGREAMCLGGGAGIALLAKDVREAIGKALGISVELGGREAKFVEELEGDYGKASRKGVDELKKTGAEVVVATCPLALAALRAGGLKAEHFINVVASAVE
ncbi:MAG: (Fe-S)-binding protein [Pyrobaculum sp.]